MLAPHRQLQCTLAPRCRGRRGGGATRWCSCACMHPRSLDAPPAACHAALGIYRTPVTPFLPPLCRRGTPAPGTSSQGLQGQASPLPAPAPMPAQAPVPASMPVSKVLEWHTALLGRGGCCGGRHRCRQRTSSCSSTGGGGGRRGHGRRPPLGGRGECVAHCLRWSRCVCGRWQSRSVSIYGGPLCHMGEGFRGGALRQGLEEDWQWPPPLPSGSRSHVAARWRCWGRWRPASTVCAVPGRAEWNQRG